MFDLLYNTETVDMNKYLSLEDRARLIDFLNKNNNLSQSKLEFDLEEIRKSMFNFNN
jgi:hypothetical protein